MSNGATAQAAIDAADLGQSEAPLISGAVGATSGDNQPSQPLPIKTAADALIAGNTLLAGSDQDDDPIPFASRTATRTKTVQHPIMNDLISSTSALSLSPGNPINSVQAPHQSLSSLPAGLMSPPGFPTPFGHTMASGLVGGGMSQSMTGFPQSHVQMHAPPPQHHMLLEHHGFSGSAAYDAFHNTGLASPLPSAPSAPSSHLGSAYSNPPLPAAQFSTQYAYQPLPPQIQQQQQQQVVVLLPSTAKIDRLQFAQVVNAVSLALQRTVEFKDLLMTVAPTPLVVMEPDSSDVRNQSAPATKVETYEQGVMVGSRTQSVGVSTAIVECKVTETQTTSANCVSIETQTEDSEMLRAILDKAMDSPTSDRHDAGNDQDPVIWFNQADLVKQDDQASSSRHSSSYSWSGSTADAPQPRALSQAPAPRSQSVSAAPNPTVSDQSSLATSRLGARGLRPSALLTSLPATQPTATSPPTSTPRPGSSPAYFPAGPHRPLAARPSLSNPPTLPPVPPPEINHPLTLVTPFRPANSGPAPYHVTLRNLRPSVTPSDLLYLARDLRSLVKVYYPPHAFFSFVGRAAVYFISDEVEAIEFARWMQGQIQRGKLRVVYELTEEDVREAELRRGLDTSKVSGWQTALAVTAYRPGKKGLGSKKESGRQVVERVERGVRERLAAGERESVKQSEAAQAEASQDDCPDEDDGEVDAGDWKQWEADMCRLFDSEMAADKAVRQAMEDEEDAAIEWVDLDEIAAMQGKKLPPPPPREPSVVRNFARMWQETAPDA